MLLNAVAPGIVDTEVVRASLLSDPARVRVLADALPQALGDARPGGAGRRHDRVVPLASRRVHHWPGASSSTAEPKWHYAATPRSARVSGTVPCE